MRHWLKSISHSVRNVNLSTDMKILLVTLGVVLVICKTIYLCYRCNRPKKHRRTATNAATAATVRLPEAPVVNAPPLPNDFRHSGVNYRSDHNPALNPYGFRPIPTAPTLTESNDMPTPSYYQAVKQI